MLTAFVVLLVLVSADDLLQGQVDRTRLLSHGTVLAGYLVMLALARPGLDFGDPPAGRRSGSRWRVRFDDAEPATPLRLLGRQRPAQTARFARPDHAA